MSKLALFLGKGGVGKTTLSAAYAVFTAAQNSRQSVLLLSTDPAHSLGDIFQRKLGDKRAVVRLERGGKLYVRQVDAEKQFRNFLNQRREEILAILESGSIFSRAEIAPFLETALPGMAEMAALLAIHDALESRRYTEVVVDTAPFGHTLRLLEMPEHFQRFLDFLEFAASRDQILAAHFGGKAGTVGGDLLSDWRRVASSLRTAFREDARLFLVTTPEKFALNQSLRCRALLRQMTPPLEISGVILNRAVRRGGHCGTCRAREKATERAQSLLKKEFPNGKFYVAEDSGAPVVGTHGLLVLADRVFAGKPRAWKPLTPRVRPVRLAPTQWPVMSAPLTLVLGKGGVGKTTVSAALGFHTRHHGRRAVEICSVDPAPSLDDIFEASVTDEPRSVLGDPGFRASEMDAVKVFQDWARQVKSVLDEAMTSNHSGVHVDLWFERKLFEYLLDSVPPGLDEILAVFRILDLLAQPSRRVIVDMAPTGHALELLRTPERVLVWTRLLLKTLAPHRKLAFAQDVGVRLAQLARQVRDLVEVLGDSKRASIYTVTLAESLPDRETERLIRGLRALGFPLGLLFVNRVLFEEDVETCGRCQRAREGQLATLRKLRQHYRGLEILVCRNFPAEIAGKRMLRSFTGELWRLG